MRRHYEGGDSDERSESDYSFVVPAPVEPSVPLAPWGAVPPAPVFRPTVEEFQDPLNYISSISSVGKKFGICKIIPPEADMGWKVVRSPIPPTIDAQRMSFRTKLQNIHQLKHRTSQSEAFFSSYYLWQLCKRVDVLAPPVIDDVPVDLWDLFRVVVSLDGLYRKGLNRRSSVNWADVVARYVDISVLSGNALRRKWRNWLDGDDVTAYRSSMQTYGLLFCEIFIAFLHEYEKEAFENPEMAYEGMSEEEITSFGYAQGPVQSLARFREKADELAKKYGLDELSVNEIERLFWQIVDGGETRLLVEYGNDLSVRKYGSGFAIDTKDPVSRHPWNLNKLPKMPTSLFHHTKEVIHGVTDPMLYFGMTFTSFAWHVEDHFLYSINYHHGGAAKVWYSVGSDNAALLEQVMKRELPYLFDKHPDLLHQLVTMVCPADLKRHNVPVFKAVQEPGEFVVTFPRGYHSGFNSGFNLAEAVNFAMPDWIPFGVSSLSNYRSTHRMCAFSHEELILACARSFPVSQVSVHLLQEMYRLASDYDTARHKIFNAGVRKYAKISETEDVPQCSICKMDCYFACLKCSCAPAKQACLSCVNDVNWCTGSCQGIYLTERVPMDVLESLIHKLENRLDLVRLCSLSGCSECVKPSQEQQQQQKGVTKKSSAERSKVQKMARRGGMAQPDVSMQKRSRRGVFYFVEDHFCLEGSVMLSASALRQGKGGCIKTEDDTDDRNANIRVVKAKKREERSSSDKTAAISVKKARPEVHVIDLTRE